MLICLKELIFSMGLGTFEPNLICANPGTDL